MSSPLSGRTALITGASRGIGAAVAQACARAGAHVILTARTVGGLEAIDDKIRAEGGTATLMPLDLLNLEELDPLGPTLLDRFGGLDILIGNAGFLGTLGPLAHTDPKEWQKVLDLNVTANFRLIRTLDPLLRASNAGRAVFVSTNPGVVQGRAYWGAYAVSKAALETMVKTYAAETEKTNLRVNIVNPGAVRTRMRAQAMPGEDPETLPAPEDITDVFLRLIAPDCAQHGKIVNAQE